MEQAEILPILKTSQVIKSLTKHLRPIALTPVLSNMLASFVVSWTRGATVHRDTAYGGIKDSSTMLALIKMLHYNFMCYEVWIETTLTRAFC